jgi:hypothetical protein
MSAFESVSSDYLLERGGNRTLPPVLQHHAAPLLEPVLVERISRIHDIQQNVIEKRLESRQTGPLHGKQRGQRVGAGDTDRQDLSQGQNEPEIAGLEIGEFRAPSLLRLGLVRGERDLTSTVGARIDDFRMAVRDDGGARRRATAGAVVATQVEAGGAHDLDVLGVAHGEGSHLSARGVGKGKDFFSTGSGRSMLHETTHWSQGLDLELYYEK